MTEVVCGILTDGEGRVLACRRGPGRHLAGLWEFPGGKIEGTEKPEEALRRELREELGILVEVGAKLEAVAEWTDGTVSIRLSGYRCRISGGMPQAIEHDRLKWCEGEELSGLQWAEADLPFVRELTRSP